MNNDSWIFLYALNFLLLLPSFTGYNHRYAVDRAGGDGLSYLVLELAKTEAVFHHEIGMVAHRFSIDNLYLLFLTSENFGLEQMLDFFFQMFFLYFVMC